MRILLRQELKIIKFDKEKLRTKKRKTRPCIFNLIEVVGKNNAINPTLDIWINFFLSFIAL